MTLVDTNILLDLATDDAAWSDWSLARLEEAVLAGPILINDIVYAETSIRYTHIEDLDALKGLSGEEHGGPRCRSNLDRRLGERGEALPD